MAPCMFFLSFCLFHGQPSCNNHHVDGCGGGGVAIKATIALLAWGLKPLPIDGWGEGGGATAGYGIS